MRIPAAILLATLVATPAMAVDIVSGSGAVVKNGAGLTVVNGDSCDGRMEASCLDHEDDRRQGGPRIVTPAEVPTVIDRNGGCEGTCKDYYQAK